MSAIATPRLIPRWNEARNSSQAAQSAARLPWSLFMTAFIVGVVFFVAGHDFFTSRAVAYTQTAEEMQTAALGGNMARRFAFLALAGWGLVLFAMSKQRLRIDWPLAGSLFTLMALATASVLWSEDSAMCIRRLLVLVCCGIAAAGIARAFSLREIAWLVVVVIGSLAAIGVLTEIMLGTFRPWVGDYRFAGTVHPNTQGPALAALCLAVFALAKDSGRLRPLLWSIFAAGMLLLVLTKSRTATAALLASLACVQLMKLQPRTQISGGIATAWVVTAGLCCLWIYGFDPVTYFPEIILLGRSEEWESLSGRAFIWPEVVRYARERFWFGYGYEGFWTPARIEDISDELGWGLREAHNGYLEMWLWLGVAGLALMLFAAIAAVLASLRGLRVTNDRSSSLALGLIVFGLLNSCLESGVIVVSLVPFLLGCCLLRLALFRDQGAFPAGSERGSGAWRVEKVLTIPGSRFAPG